MTRPKDIGTAGESAVVRYLQGHGFPHAERRALRGTYDCGDVVGIPGVCIEIKAGAAAKNASDGQVDLWLAETERERINAKADIGLLVLVRKGIGAPNAGRWWAITPVSQLTGHSEASDFPVRMHLWSAALLLRRRGYGTPLEMR